MTSGKRIARNTACNGAGRLWEAAIGLALAAYIVARLGPGAYGLWGIVGALTGYAALLDVGMGSAYAKYIAEHASRGERRAVSSVVSTGFFFYLVFGTAFLAISWALVDLAFLGLTRSNLLAPIPEDLAREAPFLLKGTLLLFVAGNCLAPFTAVLTGLQRMDLTNAVGAVAALVKLGATVYFLEAGHGVMGILYAHGAVMAVHAALTIAVACYLYPGLSVSMRKCSRKTFHRLFQFGWRAQMARLANLVTFETDVLIIAVILRDLELVGLYKIGVELANKVRQIPVILLSALVPAVSDLHARADAARVKRLFLLTAKYLGAVAVPLTLFVVVTAPILLAAWMGTDRSWWTAAVTAQILAVGYLFNVLPGPGVAVTLGRGHAGLQMKAGLISMASNIALTMLLLLTIGFWGIPIATAASMIIAWLWFARAAAPELDVTPSAQHRAALAGPLTAALPAFTLCAAAVLGLPALNGRGPNGLALLALAALFGALYMGLLWRIRYFDGYDTALLRQTLGFHPVKTPESDLKPLSS